MGLLGAHMSIAGGLYKAIERGETLGCESIQIFTTSSRTWKCSVLDEATIGNFKSTLKKAKTVKRVVAHNSYLLNLSTANEEIRKKSIEFFVAVMDQCEALGIESLITHPGSHLGAGIAEGIKATSKSLKEILKICSGYKTKILLENTAGQGACIGHEFEQLAQIAEGTGSPEKIFYCFDTQHAFAAGYDLRTSDGYEEVMGHFDDCLGTKRLLCFHINDAVKELNCRVDRHENIGKGFLGKEAFRPLVNDKRFSDIPMCLETFPGDDDENHKKDLKLLRSLVATKAPAKR